jgi:EAL and modified HD-GYP domain-containing signal transduction protein
MAGMFSLLGILFGLSLEEVLKPLQISDALVNAVLRREGEIGRLLHAVELAERGEAEELTGLLASLPLPVAEFNRLTLEAHRWMLDVIRDDRGGDHVR